MSCESVRAWTSEEIAKLNNAFDQSPFLVKMNQTRSRRRWAAFFRLFRSIRSYEKIWGRDLCDAFDRMFDVTSHEQVWRRFRGVCFQHDLLLVPLGIRLRAFKNHRLVILRDGWEVSKKECR